MRNTMMGSMLLAWSISLTACSELEPGSAADVDADIAEQLATPDGSIDMGSTAGDSGDQLDGQVADGDGPKGATWTAVYRDVIDATCNNGSCHAAGRTRPNLSSKSVAYKSLFAKNGDFEVCYQAFGPLVVARNAASSPLYIKLAGPSCMGTQMPLNRPPLPESQIELVRDWINAGAADN